MNTLHNRFFVIIFFIAMLVISSAFTLIDSPQNSLDVIDNVTYALVSEYVETQNTLLLASNAELYIAGSDTLLIGSDAIRDFLNHLYHSHGVTLGVETTLQNITPLSDELFMVEYSYHGTAFSGEVYPVETMMDDYPVDIPMISLLEIENGLIVREYLFDANVPEAARINFFTQ